MNFHTEDFRPANEANDVAEPFSYMLPRDITLAPKAFLIDRFVGAAETSLGTAHPMAASPQSRLMLAAMSRQVSTTVGGQ